LKWGHLALEDTTMQTPSINTRVQRVQRIAVAYVANSGTDGTDFVTDLLADVMHYCAAKRLPFCVSFSRAQGHFAAERLENGP